MARRNQSASCCDHCGRQRGHENACGLQRVPVEPRRPDVPDVGRMTLCRECRNRSDRTIHLRYRVG
jgi:hypothetical protein